MAEIRTVTTLRSKRDDIQAAIANYERRLAQARADLAHVAACIAIFEVAGDTKALGAYADLHRIFKYGEMVKLCTQALAKGPRTTREVAAYVAKAKGLDAGDRLFVRAIMGRIIHCLRMQQHRRRFECVGRKGSLVWRLPPEKTLV